MVVIYHDNTSTINMSKNPIMHSKTKHITIKYHYLRERVQAKEVRLEYVAAKEHVADIFKRPLPKDMFEYLVGRLRVIPSPEMN